MKRAILRLAALLSAVALVAAAPMGEKLTAYLDAGNRDPNCPACRDFWRYANGGWLAKNPIPADRGYWGIDHALDDANRALLRAALERAQSTKPAAGSNEQIAGDYYAACMNEAAIEAAGATPLQPELQRIDAIADLPAVVAESARFSALGIGDAFFSLGWQPDPKQSSRIIAEVGQSGLTLPDRDYYFRNDDATTKIRARFVTHVQTVMTLAGESADAAASDAQAVMRIESGLAKPQLERAVLRDPHVVTNPFMRDGMTAFGTAIDWPAYFAAHGIADNVAVNVDEPSYIKAVETQLAAAPLADLKAYLRFRYVQANSSALSKAFVDENFAFGSLLSGAKTQQPRWRRCLAQTDGALGDIIGQIFVAATFPPSAKARADAMVANLRAVLGQDIDHLDWMSAATKTRAKHKLSVMVQKIGYPDHWRSYAALTVTPADFFADRQSALRIDNEYELRKIGKPTNRSDWGLEPQLINAQYDPTNNDITFPAAILQPPYYRAGDDDAMNYGAIGAIIGHEITHGFDDQGRLYDENGNLAEWWTPADATRFQGHAHCIIDQYDHTVAVGNVHYVGKQDSGEAIADLGGLKIAYHAFERAQAGEAARQHQRLHAGAALLHGLCDGVGGRTNATRRCACRRRATSTRSTATACSSRCRISRSSRRPSIANRATGW